MFQKLIKMSHRCRAIILHDSGFSLCPYLCFLPFFNFSMFFFNNFKYASTAKASFYYPWLGYSSIRICDTVAPMNTASSVNGSNSFKTIVSISVGRPFFVLSSIVGCTYITAAVFYSTAASFTFVNSSCVWIIFASAKFRLKRHQHLHQGSVPLFLTKRLE